MADALNGQQIGLNQGKGVSSVDKLGMFLQVFSGEVLTAFSRTSVTMNRHLVRSISHGKAATFPVLGRASARYLATGTSLDTGRKEIKGSQRTITIDGLLTSDVLIYDIEDALNHFDVRSEYTKQLGESLALSADGAVLAELAKTVNLNKSGGLSNENIEGLGKPSILKAFSTAQKENMVERGKGIIAALTTARAKLTANYVPAGERYFYTTPENYSAILAALMPNSANYAALIDPETGNIRNVMGFEVIETPHLTLGGADSKHEFPTASAGDKSSLDTTGVGKANVVGLYMHRSALGTVKLRDLSLERARRAEYQADMIVAKYAMGHGYLRPEAVGALVETSN